MVPQHIFNASALARADAHPWKPSSVKHTGQKVGQGWQHVKGTAQDSAVSCCISLCQFVSPSSGGRAVSCAVVYLNLLEWPGWRLASAEMC